MKELVKKISKSLLKVKKYLNLNLKKFKKRLSLSGLKKLKCFSLGIAILMLMCSAKAVYAADDPLSVINNLSNFIFGLIRAVGMIILGFSIVQIGLSIKSHDPSQRANGFLTLAGGVVITFAKEILNIITGG